MFSKYILYTIYKLFILYIFFLLLEINTLIKKNNVECSKKERRITTLEDIYIIFSSRKLI